MSFSGIKEFIEQTIVRDYSRTTLLSLLHSLQGTTLLYCIYNVQFTVHSLHCTVGYIFTVIHIKGFLFTLETVQFKGTEYVLSKISG